MTSSHDSSNENRLRPGLTDGEAARRLLSSGPNELPSERGRGWWRLAAELLREPMLLLLVAAAVIYLALGSRGEAVVLLVGACFIIGIELYQEWRSERALDALRELSSPRALVIRDGRARRIPGREVVVGDLVEVGEGDRVPADARLVEGENLLVDESLLTGESVPVSKRSAGDEQDGASVPPPGGEGGGFVYGGTLVVRGRGLAEVVRTGPASEMGRIGASLHDIEAEDTPLRQATRRIVRIAGALALVLCLVVATLYATLTGSWLEGFLAGISLAISMIPEEFPVVLTVFLAMGAWRLSHRQVLTRRAIAIEALGSATTLCADKTGTITFNRMTVAELDALGRAGPVAFGPEAEAPLDEALHELAECALLASRENPADPMEQAIDRFARTALAATKHLHGDWTRVREYPLSANLLALSEVWRAPNATRFLVAAKGAPESIVDLCHLEGDRAAAVADRANAMAASGLRVLAVARASFDGATLPRDQHDFDFELLGLVGLSDPPRPNVSAALAECRRAGLRVIMITGDHPATAKRIAAAIGLAADARVMTGDDLAHTDDAALAARIRDTSVFARIVPAQKLRLVQALAAGGEVVAMTGDGVNDAPALKAAHIGIAMGGRGTDVAREAASIVLLDDDFSSIVAAVRMGRRIYDNLRRAVVFIIAVHIPIAGVALIPLLLDWPLLLYPVHIAFMELVVDPACSLAFEGEPEEANVMARPPRPAGEALLPRGLLGMAVLQGLGVLATVLGVFALALSRGQGAAEARTLMFTTLVLSYLGLIAGNRSWTRSLVRSLAVRNPLSWAVSGSSLVLLGLVLWVPPLRDAFRFSAMHPSDLAACAVAAVVSTLFIEASKLLRVRLAARVSHP